MTVASLSGLNEYPVWEAWCSHRGVRQKYDGIGAEKGVLLRKLGVHPVVWEDVYARHSQLFPYITTSLKQIYYY